MLKDKLSYIKNDMLEVRGNRKWLRALLKTKLAEIENERKAAIADNNALDVCDESKAWLNSRTNETFRKRKIDAIWDEYENWHNDQSYYLIYRDGSETVIDANEILAGGKPFPKMTSIVYAEMQSADDWVDTETGDLDEMIGDCMDAGYDDRKFQYESAIAFKYGTAWSRRYAAKHPDFVPMKI